MRPAPASRNLELRVKSAPLYCQNRNAMSLRCAAESRMPTWLTVKVLTILHHPTLSFNAFSTPRAGCDRVRWNGTIHAAHKKRSSSPIAGGDQHAEQGVDGGDHVHIWVNRQAQGCHDQAQAAARHGCRPDGDHARSYRPSAHLVSSSLPQSHPLTHKHTYPLPCERQSPPNHLPDTSSLVRGARMLALRRARWLAMVRSSGYPSSSCQGSHTHSHALRHMHALAQHIHTRLRACTLVLLATQD